ncbi:hypothetical protein N9917_03485 [Deltaproteobacteria bacterium]|nr:hypothetical protein [Deltaproteobacteria bacterium]
MESNVASNTPHPLADAPDEIITLNIAAMCCVCRKSIPAGTDVYYRRTHGARHQDCKLDGTDG